MAVTYGNPTIVPAADAGTTELWSSDAPRTVTGIRWDGGTTASHAATVTDTAGVVKWNHIHAAATLGPVESTIAFRTKGLKVTVLGSGTLYIYWQDV